MENFWEYLQNLTDAKSILSNGGFVVLLIVVYAETGLFFGFFLPGDYLLFLAGILTAAGIIHVPIYVLVPSLIVSAVLGNYTGYWFGYRTGPVLYKRNDSIFFKKRYVAVAQEFYAKYGGMALILGRFFPIVRTFAPIFAGVVKVDIKKFSLYNIVGGVAWVTTLTLAGYFLGRRFPELKDYLQYVVLALIIITTIPLIIAFVRRRYVKSKEE
ncbi:DedA family protein [Mucilaginibacter phyllosphaerae]|uniref:DedA family protein n=1 Tax=Mucilaginibacter phyllosphaerae TaxID=1812349 RepID=A0A4Y8ADJ0_9SPHI|nr:DedA family protein [Mucilaginibacter phyllosphaerae]MBB3970336.1 membrane-associated protein [Mucilaginibacter phyllosphaerae]TEW66707.1 DedA family protein [Mucilaginibacter phyllosphaerae]GGH11390.1 membrane protein [Mucilaginibacter phyllosphaerae]